MLEPGLHSFRLGTRLYYYLLHRLKKHKYALNNQIVK